MIDGSVPNFVDVITGIGDDFTGQAYGVPDFGGSVPDFAERLPVIGEDSPDHGEGVPTLGETSPTKDGLPPKMVTP
jgi:hypothetical protein